MTLQLESWAQAAVEAAEIGGGVLQDWVGRFSVREKGRANLVTEADEASQAAIVKCLKSHFPGHGFLGEENLSEAAAGAGAAAGATSTDPVWIIDPLDGTSNYVHGFPYYAVSLALMAEGRLQVGVILDPTRNETFLAVAGQGATLNGKPITTSGETTAEHAMAMASLPIAADPGNPAVRRFLTALPKLQVVQRTGSAALNLAYVAAGRIDAFWSTSLHPWDVAAGAILVREAGGVVTTLAGRTNDIFVPDLLAASSVSLQLELSQLLG